MLAQPAPILKQEKDTALETDHFAKPAPLEAQPATLAQIQELIDGGASTPVSLGIQPTSIESTEFGSPRSMLNFVKDSLNRNNYSAGTLAPLISTLLLTADLYVQAEAWILLANCYYHGKGFKRDLDEAVTLYKKAADQTHSLSAQAEAWVYLGVCSQTGKSVPINYQEAFNILHKSRRPNS